jgi:hypothetical protein
MSGENYSASFVTSRKSGNGTDLIFSFPVTMGTFSERLRVNTSNCIPDYVSENPWDTPEDNRSKITDLAGNPVEYDVDTADEIVYGDNDFSINCKSYIQCSVRLELIEISATSGYVFDLIVEDWDSPQARIPYTIEYTLDMKNWIDVSDELFPLTPVSDYGDLYASYRITVTDDGNYTAAVRLGDHLGNVSYGKVTYDAGGYSSESLPFSIDNSSTLVSLVSDMIDGTYNSNTTLTLKLVFSKNITLSADAFAGTSITLANGNSTVNIPFASVSGNTLVFSKPVSSGTDMNPIEVQAVNLNDKPPLGFRWTKASVASVIEAFNKSRNIIININP